MSKRSTKQRRAALRRRRWQEMLRYDQDRGVYLVGGKWPLHVDPWGRPCGLGTWCYFFEGRAQRHMRFLRQETLANGYWVSTVWTGTPMVAVGGWETAVFDSAEAGGQVVDERRWSSRREALAGHEEMVTEWRGKSPPTSRVE